MHRADSRPGRVDACQDQRPLTRAVALLVVCAPPRELEDLLAGDHPFPGRYGSSQAVEHREPCELTCVRREQGGAPPASLRRLVRHQVDSVRFRNGSRGCRWLRHMRAAMFTSLNATSGDLFVQIPKAISSARVSRR